MQSFAGDATGLTSGMTIEKLQRIGSSGTFVKTELPSKVGETADYHVTLSLHDALPISLSNFTDTNCTTIAGGKASLAPGESATWTCEHKLTATGKYKIGRASCRERVYIKKESNSVAKEATGLTSGMTIEKLQRIGSSGTFVKTELFAEVGDIREYHVTGVQTCALPISLSNFTDTNCTTIAGGKASLAPGESATWTCEHKLTATGKYKIGRAHV